MSKNQEKSVILGITNNDNSGAAIIADGEVKAAISEERLTRVKNENAFPHKSIQYVLEHCGLKLSDIDHVSYGWSKGCGDISILNDLYSRRLSGAAGDQKDASILFNRVFTETHNNQARRDEMISWVANNGLMDKLQYVDHHESHAIGAHALSPFTSSISISADGRGDYRSLSAYKIDGPKVEHLFSLSTMDSFGFLYGRVTKLLGFKPNRHEGKITGLAAHGDPAKAMPLLEKMVDPDNLEAPMKIGKYFVPNYHEYSKELLEETAKYDKADIAAAVQSCLERYMVNLTTKLIKEHGPNNLCLSGGIFTNVKVNGELDKIDGVKASYVLPCMGDEGHPVASAAAYVFKETGAKTAMPSMKLGKPLDISALAERVKDLDLNMTEYKAVELTPFIVSQLQANAVIGIMRGRSEFGPRALCSRTILANPAKTETNDNINKRLGRTEFMPFAPIVPVNLAPQCFEGWTPENVNSLAMTQVFNCTAFFKQTSAAVTHIDNTARPQIIMPERDPFMYDLLNQWHKATGCPSLVNTSFNPHEEPIVESLNDGLKSLKDGRIDMMVVEDRYVLSRR